MKIRIKKAIFLGLATAALLAVELGAVKQVHAYSCNPVSVTPTDAQSDTYLETTFCHIPVGTQPAEMVTVHTWNDAGTVDYCELMPRTTAEVLEQSARYGRSGGLHYQIIADTTSFLNPISQVVQIPLGHVIALPF